MIECDILNIGAISQLPAGCSTSERALFMTILVISVIITFIFTVFITSILTIVIMLRFSIIYKNTENTTQVNTDRRQASQIDDQLDNGQEQRDITTRDNPSYEMIILSTEV